MIGLHIQTPVPDWNRTLTRFPDGTWIKAVDNVQLLEEAKRLHSGIKTVLRHWYDGGQIFGTVDQLVLRNRAREFFNTFIDGTFAQFAHNVDAIEEWNEYNATSHTGQDLAERVAWADAVSWVWANEYRIVPKYAHIRLVLGNVAIGNDLPWQYAKFAYERDCILGYHPYVPVRDNQALANEWDYYSGRWAVMDAAFRQRGYYCQWLFTEFGPVGYSGEASLNALDGWRHSTVCGADTESYINIIDYWLKRTSSWNGEHGNRALGAVLFTTGGGAQWQHFETRQPEIDAISEYMGGWSVPPPIEPPPLPIIREYARTVHLLPQNATDEQAHNVLGVALPKKQSVVWSADDAVMNPDALQAKLTAKHVIVWGDVPGGSLTGWEAWVMRHYSPYPDTMTYRSFAEFEAFRFEAWPTDYKEITQGFGANPEYYGQFGLPGHEGLGLRALHGTPCYAVADGLVYEVEQDDGEHNYGTRIRIRHANGFKTIYAHLHETTVQVDQVVKAGDLIGLCDNTGNSFGSHLHLTLKHEGATARGETKYPHDQINPMPYMEHLI